MTDVVTEDQATETPETPEVSEVSETTRAWVAQGVQMLNGQIDQLNTFADRAEKVANSSKRVFEIRDDENTNDDTVKKFQTAREKILKQLESNEQKIEEYIRTNLMENEGDEPFDETSNAESYKVLKTVVDSTLKALTLLNGGGELSNVKEIKSLAGVRKSGNTGTGTAKPRFASVQYRVAGENTWNLAEMDKRDSKTKAVIGKTSNLTALALKLSGITGVKLSAVDFQDPMFAEAGTHDLSTLAGKEIKFVKLIGEKNYEIQVIPQGK